MRLKRLYLHGFKTFAPKTELLFGEGLTAVVGPNGSGKSNIDDAVRWALGEQSLSNLRAKRTEAVAGLEALWTAQRDYYSEHGVYAASFKQLAFEINGGTLQSPTQYTGGRYTYQLSQPWGATSFYCIATAQLDADPWPDILEIYEVPGE